MSKLVHNLSWFRMKLRIFHAIMYPLFFIELFLNLIMPLTQTEILDTLHPFITPLQMPLYWLSIALACVGFLKIEFSNTFIYPNPSRIIPRHCQRNLPQTFMFSSFHCHPLLKRFTVLSGATLNQVFIGWLPKTGRNVDGFMHSMHKVGKNFTCLTSLYTNTASKSVKKTASKASSQFRTKSLFIILFTITSTNTIIQLIPPQGKLLCKVLLRNTIVFHKPQ